MLDQFAQIFQHCCDHARALHVVYKVLWVVSIPRCTTCANIFGSAASVCTPLLTRKQQLPTLLAQQCWELLCPFTNSFTGKNIICSIRTEMINSIMFLKLNLVLCLFSNVFDSHYLFTGNLTLNDGR